jgi:hypothetical protein
MPSYTDTGPSAPRPAVSAGMSFLSIGWEVPLDLRLPTLWGEGRKRKMCGPSARRARGARIRTFGSSPQRARNGKENVDLRPVGREELGSGPSGPARRWTFGPPSRAEPGGTSARGFGAKIKSVPAGMALGPTPSLKNGAAFQPPRCAAMPWPPPLLPRRR